MRRKTILKRFSASRLCAVALCDRRSPWLGHVPTVATTKMSTDAADAAKPTADTRGARLQGLVLLWCPAWTLFYAAVRARTSWEPDASMVRWASRHPVRLRSAIAWDSATSQGGWIGWDVNPVGLQWNGLIEDEGGVWSPRLPGHQHSSPALSPGDVRISRPALIQGALAERIKVRAVLHVSGCCGPRCDAPLATGGGGATPTA